MGLRGASGGAGGLAAAAQAGARAQPGKGAQYARPRRMLICEDSVVYAAALRRVLEYDGDISVAAVCTTAEEAIAALPAVRPDLVTMDIELPGGMDGISAVEEIMSSAPLPILVLSGQVGRGTDRAAAALAAGAVDALGKDDLDLRDPASPGGRAFRHRVKVLSRAHVIRHPRARLRSWPDLGPVRQASVVGVCSSTGGPHVLARLLEVLPADYQVPVLVVQHIAAGFTEGMVRWLDRSVAVPVRIAAEGVLADPGAWVAPEGAHLVFSSTGQMHLDRHTVRGRHRPSGDVLLDSIAAVAGRSGVAIVLSGMGNDGAAGAGEVRRHGGLAIAQDEASSAVFGMPKAAIDHGVDIVLPPEEIAASLLRLRYEPLRGTQ